MHDCGVRCHLCALRQGRRCLLRVPAASVCEALLPRADGQRDARQPIASAGRAARVVRRREWQLVARRGPLGFRGCGRHPGAARAVRFHVPRCWWHGLHAPLGVEQRRVLHAEQAGWRSQRQQQLPVLVLPRVRQSGPLLRDDADELGWLSCRDRHPDHRGVPRGSHVVGLVAGWPVDPESFLIGLPHRVLLGRQHDLVDLAARRGEVVGEPDLPRARPPQQRR
mmetsp:Transcript_30092/g.68378  ORF Transcript_30092/g.68378 Transcript_30092/m.68378 type:complete len:224 (+) Transcript_30092:522-1193(+)